MSYASEQLEHYIKTGERKRKRIVVELPTDAVIARISYIFGTPFEMSAKLIRTDELKEGNVIVCDPETDE